MRRAICTMLVSVLFLAIPHGAFAGSGQKHSKNKTPAPADASAVKEGPAFTLDPLLMDGYRALYEQDFPSARAKFTAWSAAHPEEAFGQVSLAAGYLFD